MIEISKLPNLQPSEIKARSNLTNRYKVVYLDKIDTLVIYVNGIQIYSGKSSDADEARKILADHYIYDNDNLAESYHSALDAISDLPRLYKSTQKNR